MGRNVDTKQKVVKFPITEYSIKHNISTATCRNWIKSGKVEFEMVDGKYFIFDYEVPTNTIDQNFLQTLVVKICWWKKII